MRESEKKILSRLFEIEKNSGLIPWKKNQLSNNIGKIKRVFELNARSNKLIEFVSIYRLVFWSFGS